MESLTCPLCSSPVPSASLRRHVREELGLASHRCLLCPAHFFAEQDALEHFRAWDARHPHQPVAFAELRHGEREERLRELVQSAEAAKPCPGCPCGRTVCAGDTQPPGGDAWDRHKIKRRAEEPKALLSQPEHRYPEQYASEEESAPPPPRVMTSPPEPRYQEEQASEMESAQSSWPNPYEPGAVLVKPEPEDVVESKPLAPSDGKVACLLCGHRVEKANFKQHAQRRHLAAFPFHCSSCPFKTRLKHHLVGHVRKAHGVAQPGPRDMTILSMKGEVERKSMECFGSFEQHSYAKAVCRECRTEVNARAKREHVAEVHLKEPVHQCRLCDFASTALRPSQLAAHLKAQHNAALNEGTAVSHLQRLLPILQKIIPDYFDTD